MRMFTNTDAAHSLRQLYDRKAVFAQVLSMMHPAVIADPTLDDELLGTMETEAVAFLDKVLHQSAGSDTWPQAIVIAYAPNTLVGYKRVAEYYRRAEAIQAL